MASCTQTSEPVRPSRLHESVDAYDDVELHCGSAVMKRLAQMGSPSWWRRSAEQAGSPKNRKTRNPSEKDFARELIESEVPWTTTNWVDRRMEEW